MLSLVACSWISPSDVVAEAYTGPGPALVTVQQALQEIAMVSDGVAMGGISVSLRGKITQIDEYDPRGYHCTFVDSTGAIDAFLSNDYWHALMGQSISESDTVELSGLVYRKTGGGYISVYRILKQK